VRKKEAKGVMFQFQGNNLLLRLNLISMETKAIITATVLLIREKTQTKHKKPAKNQIWTVKHKSKDFKSHKCKSLKL